MTTHVWTRKHLIGLLVAYAFVALAGPAIYATSQALLERFDPTPLAPSNDTGKTNLSRKERPEATPADQKPFAGVSAENAIEDFRNCNSRETEDGKTSCLQGWIARPDVRLVLERAMAAESTHPAGLGGRPRVIAK